VEGDGLHAHEVDDPGVVLLQADGDLHGGGVQAQLVAHLRQDAPRVRARAVALVVAAQVEFKSRS
jgi:hypothetical protein